MIIFAVLSFCFFIFSIFLIVQIFKLVLFFIYLIQLKEYRIDRLKAYFKTLSGKQEITKNLNFLRWNKFFHPRLTLRSGLMLILIFLLQYHLFFLFLKIVYLFCQNFIHNILLIFAFYLILFFYLNLIFIFGVFFISEIIFWPIKQLIIFLAAKKINKMNNLIVIGITGSYGKTSHKEIISFLLAQKFKILKTPFNCNTRLGISLLILKKLRLEHRVFIVEMGAYKKGEIKDICNLVQPKIGILTGINEQHLELFGSLKKTIAAKYELIASLPKDGFALFNANNKYSLKLANKKGKLRKIIYGQEKRIYQTQLLGKWNQEAFQAGLIVGKHLGLTKREMIKRFAKFKAFSLGIKIEKGKRGIIIIDDSYNSNPSGFLAALNLVKGMKKNNNILITPGIIELGKVSNKIHQQIGRQAALICQRIILTKKDFYNPFFKGIRKVKPKFTLEVETNTEKLVKKLNQNLKRNSLILLEGRVSTKLKKSLMIND